MARKISGSDPSKKEIVTLKHEGATRKNIPTAEYESVMKKEQQTPLRVAYERRNRDLDPQLVWRGKDQQDWSDLVVPAPPLFIQEKIHPKVLIDDLRRQADAAEVARKIASGTAGDVGDQIDLFADFNGLPNTDAKTDFYAHDAHWANRLILGDSLQVMASLAEREGLRGKVQCIYIDPPYGIKFNSNFQWSTTSRDIKDGNREHISREPEQVKAFRDTWRDGVHSYLTYLRDRLIASRDLLTESGSIFVQIGDENAHRVRSLLDEVFGPSEFICSITFVKTSSSTGDFLGPTYDTILWYAKQRASVKFRRLLVKKAPGQKGGTGYKHVQSSNLSRRPLTSDEIMSPEKLASGSQIYFRDNLTSQSVGRDKGEGAASWFGVNFEGQTIKPSLSVRWKTNEQGFSRLIKAYRVEASSGNNLGYIRFLHDYPVYEITDVWSDTLGQNQFGGPKTYVVQTALTVVERCILMASDPGDLVLDPTCGSGTTAYVAEQWGRRWITIDTSRVALALARARIMGARYPYYLKADSREGQLREAEVTRKEASNAATHNSLRQGFVYERVPHVTLKSIANNAEIDVIWEKFQARLEPLRETLNRTLKKKWEEWDVPREADDKWPAEAKDAHARWWEQRIARQKEIDASIAAKAECEFLYDKPYDDKKKVRVAGPFTVESLSPHRTLGVGADDELLDPAAPRAGATDPGNKADFATMILDNLRTAGVQQAHKEDKINFTSLTGWPGTYICAEGRYNDADGAEKRAGIFIGPEFGTVARQDLVTAAREAGDANFDVLIACAFNYEAHASEFHKLGRIPVLKARMNAELHMGTELKNTGKGNLFVIFGEPDITLLPPDDAAKSASLAPVSASMASTFSTPRPAKSVATAPTASPAGSSTPITTRKASSFATPTFSAPMTPTRALRRR